MTLHARQVAFSLVELSIVLVILGLLVGGVLSGQSLIRASEMRSVTTQMSQITTAIYSFRDKYFALPGDITNATLFWGVDTSLCNGSPGTANTPGTCNGNGDGIIGAPVYNDNSYEWQRAWQHLANAGLIPGSYSGINYASTPGVNVPAGKISNTGFSFESAVGLGTTMAASDFYPIASATVIAFGSTIAGDATEAAAITQTEAWNIDTKLDDAKPGTGVYTVWRPSGGPEHNGADCATDNDPSIAVYKTTMNTISCSFNIQVK